MLLSEGKRNKMRILICSVLFLLIIAPGIAGHAAAPKDTLKIGLISAFSGPGMAWGISWKTTLEIVCDEMNSKGGLRVGNKTYQLKVVPYDDKGNPEGALTAANRLVYEDQVKYIFGPTISATVLSAQTITEKEKVLILCLSFTRKTLSPEKPFSFRWIPTPFEYSIDEAAWLAKNRNIKTIVISAANDESGREGSQAVTEGYQKAGVKILSQEFYERGAPDMLPLATRIMRYNPDLIEFDGGAPGDVVNIANAARSQGYKNLMTKLGGGGNTCVEAAPEALNGFIFHLESDIAAPTGKLADLLRDIRKRAPQTPVDSAVADEYSVLMMLMKAFQNAGTVDNTNAVRSALERISDFEGINGKFGWEGKETYGINHQLRCPLYLAEGVHGKIRILDKVR